MKKLDPNIIRVGDKVKILNPELFVRCGYELTPNNEDLQSEVMDKYKDKIDEFIKSLFGPIQKVNASILFEEEYSYWDDQDVNTLESKIINALCYYEVKRKGFGGKERKIYATHVNKMKDIIGKVVKIKFHKTGTYIPGSYSYSAYDLSDYDPAYLENEKTHKILIVQIPDSNYIWRTQNISIESIHVEKVIE